MPSGANHAGRTRADRKTLTAPVTADELDAARANAARAKKSLAEYVRSRCCQPPTK